MKIVSPTGAGLIPAARPTVGQQVSRHVSRVLHEVAHLSCWRATIPLPLPTFLPTTDRLAADTHASKVGPVISSVLHKGVHFTDQPDLRGN